MRRLITGSFLSILSAGLLCAGCAGLPSLWSANSTGKAPSATAATPAEGSILIARPLPAAHFSSSQGSSMALAASGAESALSSAMGFVPSFQTATANAWLVLDRKANTATLMNGNTPSESAELLDLADLPAGRYSVLLKSRNPLWYATDRYFLDRDLTVPANGSKERYLRGALGDYAIYLSKNTAIHSSPAWSSDVGGIRIEDAPLSKFYYMLPVGATIEVR